MRVTRFLTLGLYLAFGAATGLGAQTLAQNPQPAEMPPADFQGNQYVDSRGCAFIRAGVSGAVTWVPRVNRDRQLICGQEPSIAVSAATTAAATVAPAPDVVVIVPRATLQPAPAAVANTQSVTVSVPVRSAAPAPRVVTPAPTPRREVAHVRPSHPPVATERRILPAHLQADRLAARDLTVPKGYAPVWEDDRLNPRRAEQSEAGFRQTQSLWTNTVPRRLVDPGKPQKVVEPRIVSPAPGYAAKGAVGGADVSR